MSTSQVLYDDDYDEDELDLDAVETQLAAYVAEMRKRELLLEFRATIPPVFQPFFQPARYKGAHGGRGSAKSWSFAAMVLLRGLQVPGLRVVCVREVQRSLGQSVKRLLEDLIKRYDLTDKFDIGAHSIGTPGDGVIIFQGMQDHTADSIKSLEGFDIAWVEEAQALSHRSLELLRPTLRKPGSELWFTWNPRRPTDAVDQLLRGAEKPPSSIVIQANYRDNPYLPQVLRDELEWDQKRDLDKFEHIWLGGYEKNSESRVFKNWVIEEFDSPTDVAFLYGGDWGFSVDPTVLVRGFVRPEQRRLYLDYEVYQVGCEIDETPFLFDAIACPRNHEHGKKDSKCAGVARKAQIIADSARPETISYMQRHGYPGIIPARKGAGSVEEGIQFLKNWDIVVHPRMVHAIDEFTMYSYKIDHVTGLVLPVLEDKKNHVIDSIRYMVERLDRGEFASW